MRSFLLLLLFPLVFGGADGMLSSDSQSVKAVVESNNRFALKLYLFYREKYKDDNIFFSPFSISSAFSILYEGARGRTAEEIRNVFLFPSQSDVRRGGYLSLYEEMNKPGKKYELALANALWVQKDYRFLKEYLNLIKEYYGGKATNLDFRRDPEGSRKVINEWVEKTTKEKIKDLLPKGSIDSLTRMVITNAIYFKGLWIFPFDKKKTSDADFKISPGEIVKVKMMSLPRPQRFNYAETEDLQILEMLYEGEELSMLVLLPKENSLEKLEKKLSLENLNKWRDMLQSREVLVYLPKLKIERKYAMVDDLKKMGMPSAFDPSKADLSGLTGKRDLFVTCVYHQAYVDINEEGTEAAAATGIVVGRTAVEKRIIFRADHPFIFLIQDRRNGNILFMGRVYNPTK
ncbi:serpin family protein [bacterium]|nr:serpin family protein [bacterium]